MQRTFQGRRRHASSIPKTAAVKTTLFDLIRVVNEEITSGEEHLLSLVVTHMLCSSRTSLSPQQMNLFSRGV